MELTSVTDILRDALLVAIKLSAPILLLSMAVGVIIAVLQAVTQIHEQTISFILKLVVVVLVLALGGSWMLQLLQDFTKDIFALIAS
ncbi:MAG: flagellar biosynthesis protein FliQ [Firmicutes bacterium]|nr:flagellar biosynthesis protein FliQ [Bacillota bacterium]